MESDSSSENGLLQRLRNEYRLSTSEHGHPFIKVPLSQDSHMTKLVWPRDQFPSELHRWNSPEEILSYLISFESHSDWVTTKQSLKPPSGTMLLYDKKKTKHYKHDGYDWKTRNPATKTIREDRTKLKVCSHVLLYALYTHCESNSTFHRRCYWLIQNPTIVLVHYLNTSTPRVKRVTTVTSLREHTDEIVTNEPAPASIPLLTVKDSNLCQYLSKESSANNSSIQSLLASLLEDIKKIADELCRNDDTVSMATFVTCIQEKLFLDECRQDMPASSVASPSPPDLPLQPPHVLLINQAMRLLQLQAQSLQYGNQSLLPNVVDNVSPNVLLRAAASYLAQSDGAKKGAEQVPSLAPPTPAPANCSGVSEESDFLETLHPPSLDSLQSILPEPLDVDPTPPPVVRPTVPAHSSNDDVAQFAQSLLTMRPLEEVQRLMLTPGQTALEEQQEQHIAASSSSEEREEEEESMNNEELNFLSDEFFEQFLEELATGDSPTHNELPSLPPTQNTSLPPTQSSLLPPTQNTSLLPTQNTSLLPTQNTSLPPTQINHFQTSHTTPPVQFPQFSPIHNAHPSDHAQFVTTPSLELDSESVKLLLELSNEDSAHLPLSPVSQYMASFNGQDEMEEGSNLIATNYHSNDGYHGNGTSDYLHCLATETPFGADPTVSTATSLSADLQFADSLLQQPPQPDHTPSSQGPAHPCDPIVMEGYRTGSPIQSPSSPSQASVSSLSTGGADSYLDEAPPLVAELCELLSESPNVQQTDFSHLSLSGSEQQELLQASRVIQKTLRRCKERPKSIVTVKEKNAALLIERSYRRYQEIKRRRDEAARRIQNQYRLYRRRTDELKRAALFIQQMYRYQRRRRCPSSASGASTSTSYPF